MPNTLSPEDLFCRKSTTISLSSVVDLDERLNQFRSAAELEWIKEDVLSNPKADELVEKTDKINPQNSSIYL
jgi:hypothetical protein